MLVLEDAQRSGITAVLLLSLIFYAASLHHSRQPVRENPLPWGDQRPGWAAVEVANDSPDRGIYFLPEETTIEQIRKISGSPKGNEPQGVESNRISSGSALTISSDGELKIGEMAAARKLALGLPLDLNRVSQEDLSLVPGIGERIAFQMVQLRNKNGAFRDLSDLMAVPGIKEKRLKAIKAYLIIKQTP